jgi:S-adenosyl methyltransferase
LRSPEQIAAFLDGLELLGPGVVSTPRWRPDALDIGEEPGQVDQFCAVGREP